MHILAFVLILDFVISDDTETLGFILRGPSGPLVVPLGGSVILPCSVETPLAAQEVKVVWRKTDSETVVHLYQDGESQTGDQNKDYRDRAHFFTDQIQHGNFSLRLENVRTEDKGLYRCKVYSQQVADKTLVEIKDVEYLLVSGSDRSVSAYDGEDVTLNCSVDSHITPEHIEEVSWKKTDGDKDILVLFFTNNESLPEASDERYRDRVEFFTDEISKGNFSLRLKSVRTEDKGVYMCQVFAGGLSANATVELEQLGFSWLHILVLILCIIASGFAFLLCWLVYSKTENLDTRLCLQVCLFSCPFITMLLASIIWCVIEGSKYETISCCVLYFLGPLRLLWVTPLATNVPAKILKCVMTAHTDHVAFMTVMSSVLLAEHFENISRVFRAVPIGLLVLLCLLFIIQLAKKKLLSCSGDSSSKIIRQFVATCLPSLQLSLLLYCHFASKAVFIFTALPVLLWVSYCFCNGTKAADKFCQRYQNILTRSMIIVITGYMVYFYIMLLRNKDVDAGLVCAAGLLQALWVPVPVYYEKLRMRKMLFLYGSAGLVLVNSVALMTELIMKAVHGVRLLGDLRVIVFPSEWLFTVALLILSIVASDKAINKESPQKPSDYNGAPGTTHTSIDMNQTTGGSVEMETLRKASKNSEEEEEEELC